MAITGIAITSGLCHLMFNGHLKNHFYNTVVNSLKMDDFHHAYCKLCFLPIHFIIDISLLCSSLIQGVPLQAKSSNFSLNIGQLRNPQQ